MGDQHDGAPPDVRDSGAPLMGEATQGLSSGSGVGVPGYLLLDTQIRSFGMDMIPTGARTNSKLLNRMFVFLSNHRVGMGIVRSDYKGVSAW